MRSIINNLGQSIDVPIPEWTPPPVPPREPMEGRFCRLEPVEVDCHASELFDAFAADVEGRSWTYLAYGPFPDLASFRAWMHSTCLGSDPLFFTIIDATDRQATGMASYLRIAPTHGSIEV